MIERHRVAGLSDLSTEMGRKVEVAGHRIALFVIGEDVYAIGDRCSHAEASLSEGEIFDGAVECPRHGSEFDIRSGEPNSLPATRPVPVYPVTVEDGGVFVDLEPIQEEDE